MARHLGSCAARADAITAAGRRGKGWKGTVFRLQAQDTWSGRYWLHLEMNGSAPLAALDDYLRAIWLECCGHLSKFALDGPWSGREIDMARKAGQALCPGLELTHVYDFGSSSITTVKVVGERRGAALTRHPVVLMARNEPPVFSCIECGKPAERLCLECAYELGEEGTLCEEHAAEHPHEDYGEPIDLVNSPRLGVCGYTGPAEPPY